MSAPEISTAFNGNAEKFADYASEVRGYVRYEVVHRNLEKLVGGQSLQVADIGGGSAIDTLWLAELGHTITLVEPAEDQVALARQRIQAAPQEVQERITIIQATADQLPAEAEGAFDLVLSHGVAMYMREPLTFVQTIAKLAKTGGHISLLEKGYYGKEAHLVTERNWVGLAQFHDTGRVVNNLDRETTAFKPHELLDMLKRADAKLVPPWTGVRVVTDTMDIPISQFTPAELKAIVDVEYEQGRNEHIRGQGQMLHFIAQKVNPIN